KGGQAGNVSIDDVGTTMEIEIWWNNMRSLRTMSNQRRYYSELKINKGSELKKLLAVPHNTLSEKRMHAGWMDGRSTVMQDINLLYNRIGIL
ncbi:hypothetical protein ACJX0J_009620, partial [Zea mays]